MQLATVSVVSSSTSSSEARVRSSFSSSCEVMRAVGENTEAERREVLDFVTGRCELCSCRAQVSQVLSPIYPRIPTWIAFHTFASY